MMMKYLLRYSYFIGIALVFAALISLLTNGIRYELLPIFTLLAYIVKLFYDYNNDGGSGQALLNKSGMRLMLIIFCILFFVLNVFFFRLDGLICVLPVLYAALQTKFDVMKLFFLTIFSAMYLAMYTKPEGLWIILFLCGTLVLSTGFYVFLYWKAIGKRKTAK